MKKLYIARHGETDSNSQERYLGSINEPLNENGLKQANQLGKKLIKHKIDKIITSPLIRCIQTTEEINAFLNLNQTVKDEFRERNIGVYEGLTRKEAQETYPLLWERNITRIWYDAPTNGETIQEVVDRVFRGIEWIKQSISEKRILIVTHGFISKVINYYFKPKISEEDFFHYKLKNAEVHEYTIR